MTEFSRIDYAVSEGVARITLDRAEVRNAQDKAMLYELNDAFDFAARDDSVKDGTYTDALGPQQLSEVRKHVQSPEEQPARRADCRFGERPQEWRAQQGCSETSDDLARQADTQGGGEARQSDAAGRAAEGMGHANAQGARKRVRRRGQGIG